MTLAYLVLVLIVIGILMYLVNTIIPMPAWMKSVINAVVALVVIVWIFQAFGLVHGLNLRLR